MDIPAHKFACSVRRDAMITTIRIIEVCNAGVFCEDGYGVADIQIFKAYHRSTIAKPSFSCTDQQAEEPLKAPDRKQRGECAYV